MGPAVSPKYPSIWEAARISTSPSPSAVRLAKEISTEGSGTPQTPGRSRVSRPLAAVAWPPFSVSPYPVAIRARTDGSSSRIR